MKDKICVCSFCDMDKTKIENTILDETKYFFVIPSLGALTEGYILVISKRHINSMSELTIEEMNEYESLIKKYRNIFKNIYKKYPNIYWISQKIKRINCIDDNTKIYGTHISHDGMSYHEEIEKRAISNGYNIAYDGMELEI